VSGPAINSFADAERLARRRLPRAMFDSIISGAGKELTLRANLAAFDEVGFRPRAAIRHPAYDLSTRILGLDVASPIMIAPTGSNRMFRREGEPALARVAGEVGAAYVTSCLSGYPLDQVLAEARSPVFFNLYTIGTREVQLAMIAQAQAAGCRALVLTVDMMGTHGVERDHGLRPRAPLGLNAATALHYAPQLVTKLGWTLDFVRDKLRFDCPLWIKPDGKVASFGDVLVAFGGGATCATWQDLAWIREAWNGPIVMKGILRADDALRAAEAGVDAIVVSNHAARNVDGSPPTLQVLPGIVDAVGDRLEIWFDGGIRRGTDAIKALALGASAVLIGRAYLLAFAGAGGPGVRRMFEIFHAEMVAALRSLGCASVRELDRSYLRLPGASEVQADLA
jgi:isopentenyl diphosphate isomerase/L-lactate dehydrogenase-like FMN-dependent dehydrogenase